MAAQIIDFKRAQEKRDREDVRRGEWLAARALEMLLNGVKPKGMIS